MRNLWLLLLCFVVAAEAQDIASLKAEAERGDVHAMMELARDYETGKGVGTNPTRAFEWYRKAAEQGNVEAQNVVGIKYRLGEGVEKDKATAVIWYQKAARSGYGDAMFNLGAAYYNGDGVDIDDARSLAWFLIAAEFGSHAAPEAVQRGMEGPKVKVVQGLELAAKMFLAGQAVPARPQVAVKFLDRAIAMGSGEATIDLANLYLSGRGVERDAAKALKYCQQGADNQYPPAMTCLGQIYQTSFRSDASAVQWYEKGAGCGDENSMLRFAKMLEDGSAGRTDKSLAYSYYLVAGYASSEARVAATSLEAELSKKDRERASKKARELYEKIRLNGQCDWGTARSSPLTARSPDVSK